MSRNLNRRLEAAEKQLGWKPDPAVAEEPDRERKIAEFQRLLKMGGESGDIAVMVCQKWMKETITDPLAAVNRCRELAAELAQCLDQKPPFWCWTPEQAVPRMRLRESGRDLVRERYGIQFAEDDEKCSKAVCS